MEALENSDSLAKELGIKVHFFVNGAPEHVTFLLLEAASPMAIAQYAVSFPFEQDFKITAVMPQADMMEMAKQMAARG